MTTAQQVEEWRLMLRRTLDGEVLQPHEIIDPPPINLGVILRSGTRRYVDSNLGVGLGGMVYDGTPETGWYVVEDWRGGIQWHKLDHDELDWLEYTGIVQRKVVKDIRRSLVRNMRGREDDRRYTAALNVIAGVLS